MATNGICSIKVTNDNGDRIEYPLYFGRQAIEEIAIRTEQHFSPNGFKILLDMIYGGTVAHATKNGLPFPSEQEIYALVESFLDEEDSAEQHDALEECFRQSKYGSDYLKKLEDIKKKMESYLTGMKSAKKNTGKR